MSCENRRSHTQAAYHHERRRRTDGRNGRDDLAELQLVQDGGLASGIQADHQNAHLLVAHEALPQLAERGAHGRACVVVPRPVVVVVNLLPRASRFAGFQNPSDCATCKSQPGHVKQPPPTWRPQCPEKNRWIPEDPPPRLCFSPVQPPIDDKRYKTVGTYDVHSSGLARILIAYACAGRRRLQAIAEILTQAMSSSSTESRLRRNAVGQSTRNTYGRTYRRR